MLGVRMVKSDYGYNIKIAIIDKQSDRIYVAKPLEFIDVTNSCIENATFEIRKYADFQKDFTSFMLDWIKIAEDLNIKLNQDFSKEREAMKYHLEDMRKLVFLKNK